MKTIVSMILILMNVWVLSGCQTNSSPSLAGNTRPTSRLPSPGAPQRNSALTASTMIAPARP